MRLGLGLGFSRGAPLVPPVTDAALSAAVIAETAAQGTPVGVFSVVGGKAPISYALTDSAGGRFQVSGAALQAGAAATDFETGASQNVTVRATDAANRTFDKSFTITVTDIVDEDEYRDWMTAA